VLTPAAHLGPRVEARIFCSRNQCLLCLAWCAPWVRVVSTLSPFEAFKLQVPLPFHGRSRTHGRGTGEKKIRWVFFGKRAIDMCSVEGRNYKWKYKSHMPQQRGPIRNENIERSFNAGSPLPRDLPDVMVAEQVAG